MLTQKAQQSEPIRARILLLALELRIEPMLGSFAPGCEILRMPMDLEKLMDPIVPAPDVILCGPPPESIALNEVAQALRMQHQESAIFYVASTRAGYDKKTFVKNGFSDAFLLPIDSEVLQRAVTERIASASRGSVKSYRSVKLIDIEPGTQLEFETSIYLPMNDKYIRYSAAGDPLDENRIKKLWAGKMNSIYVSTEQMPKFYSYTANQLKKLGSGPAISVTERKEKLEGSIRDLLSGIFDDTAKSASFDQGQALVRDCQEIVKSYILCSDNGDWYKKLLSAMGELSTGYSHPANVSTYASLFSIGLQAGNPSDLATAGLLHDIGLADVPQEVVLKPEEQRTSEEKAQYEKHCENSINIIKNRRIVISEGVQKAILQHHECFNGSGYPQGLVGSRTAIDAQILSLADRFDDLTSAAAGKALMTPAEAVGHFRQMLANDPGRMIIDPELIRKVLRLFPQ